MILKPQDVLILLKLVSIGSNDWAFGRLADDLSMSPSEVHAGIKRANQAQLYDQNSKQPRKSAFFEFLLHGVKYAFPAIRGELTRGIPTSFAAPPLVDKIAQPDVIPVWPYSKGKKRGYTLKPLYRSVPDAALRDTYLYELLALVDALRDGSAREVNLASQEIQQRLDVS